MNEVLQKLLLVIAVVLFFIAGCATTHKSSYTITGDRIEFPYYGLSIMRPSNDFEMLEKEMIGEWELVVWKNKKLGIVIGISVWGADLNYQEINEIFAKYICDGFRQDYPDVSYKIKNAKEVIIRNKKFHQTEIFLYGISANIAFKTVLYLYKTNDFIFHFAFLEDRSDFLTTQMMQSVTFFEGK